MTRAGVILIMVLYLVAVNLAGFYLMGKDKNRARKREWRVREAAFFLLSLLGGGAGCFAGMYYFRHKTKHLSFVVGIPLCTIAGLALYGAVFYFFLSCF